MLANYKIVVQIGHNIRMIRIEAATPFEAYNKFKSQLSELAFSQISINRIKEVKPKRKNRKLKEHGILIQKIN